MPVATKSSPHAQFVQEIKDLMASTSSIAAHLQVLTSSFQQVLVTSPEAKQDLLASSAQLAQGLKGSTATLQDCLRDLATMGEAMTPVMESSPEAAPALLVNLYTTFFRQLRAYFRDVTDNFTASSPTFERGRAAFNKEQFATSTTSAPQRTSDRVQSLPNTPRDEGAAAATEAPAKRKKKTKMSLEDEMGESAPKAAAAEAAVRSSRHNDGAALVAPTSSGLAPPTAAPSADTGAGTFGFHQGAHEDPEVAALAAAAAVGGAQKARRGKGRRALDNAEASASPPPSATAYTPPANEPSYLVVTTSVEDALGRLVRASRPNFFSNVDTFLRRSPVATYYVQLMRPGSLALFIVKSYVNVDEDAQADLFCDVLDTDTVEVEPVESPTGEVIIHDEGDLRDLAVCAWRVGNNEDHTRLLYTTYALVEQRYGDTVTRSALVQDSYVVDGRREEVLHVVSLFDVAPQFAKVTVYAQGGRGGGGGPKTSAIVSLMRNSFNNSGFTEVAEADVLAAVPCSQRDSSTELQKLRAVSTAAVNATDAFQPSVELASLREPAKQGRANITMDDVKRGVLRGGVEMLKAPLTVGRMVGGAMLDVTGASDAIRSSVEGLFRRTFPNLAQEPVLDNFNCAWQEGTIMKQGYLFVAVRWLCFAGSMVNAHFSVEYDEIKDVQKARSSMLDNSIRVITHLNEEYYLTSFMHRDDAFHMIMQQWLQ